MSLLGQETQPFDTFASVLMIHVDIYMTKRRGGGGVAAEHVAVPVESLTVT